jgi:hypothetical protein
MKPKRTIMELKIPYRGFGFITIPRGTKVTRKATRYSDGIDYHQVIDLDVEFGIKAGMDSTELKKFVYESVYYPIRVPAKFVI